MNMLRILLALALFFLPLSEAAAGSSTITTKDAAGTTRTFVVTTDGSGNFVGQSVICDGTAAANCAAVDSSGRMSVLAIQPTAANLNATVIGTGTFVVQAASTLAAETTKVIGTVRNLGNAGAAFDAATAAAVPANALYTGINVAGNMRGLTGLALGTTFSPTVAIVDASGNQVTSFGGSGGTASNFGSAFPSAGTAIGLTNGTNMVAWSATSNYGTAPSAIAVPAVNAFVTNSNNNGSAVSSLSSPVVIASDQVAVAVKAASGTIASGAVASGAYASGSIGSGAIASGAFASGSIGSGAIASGAVASGAVASGAYASGSLASGAVVDITNISVAPGAAPPSKVVALGANASGATGGFMAGLVQCDSKAIYDASTNGSTELVALTSGRTIYVCGYSIISGGTVNVKLIYGTGTACATGSNNMTPAFQLTAQVGLVDGSPFYRGLKTASANALCINTSAGVAAQAIVYYSVI